jgi:hypothetical protein
MINVVVVNEFQKPSVIKGKKYDALDVVHVFKIDIKKPCVLVVMKLAFAERKISLVNVSIKLNLVPHNPLFHGIHACNAKPSNCRNINNWNLLSSMFFFSNGMANKCFGW